MSLRSKLILSFLMAVLLVSGVGLVALEISRRLHNEVEALVSRSGYQVPVRPPKNLALEIEGEWDGLAFTATEVERLPKPRRPKLRGTLDGVDSAAGKLTIFGVDVLVEPTATFEPVGGSGLATLVPGNRVEISCRLDDAGQLTARLIRTSGLKRNDKIKGTVRSASADGVWPDTIDVAGVFILVGRQKPALPTISALDRLSIATQLEDALRALLGVTYDGVGSALMLPDSSVVRGLRDCLADVRYLANELALASAQSTGDDSQGPGKIVAEIVKLDRAVDEQVSLLSSRPVEAPRHFRSVVTPIVRNDILPMVEFQQLQLVESLADAATEVVESFERTARVMLILSIAAILLALLLGIAIWRSIDGPLTSLTNAALQIGSGRLDTRVPVTTRDELGMLATSFNQMTDRLAASMVSIDNLNVVKEQLRRSLAEKELLLKEVHHRVKNNLQIVSSLLDLQSGHATDPETQDLFAESRSRIQSMALIHEQLYRSTDFDRIDFKTYVEHLVGGLSQSLGSISEPIEFVIEMKAARLNVDAAVACGLIINELVTNAAQHAFDGGKGVVTIQFDQHDDGTNELRVSDDGKGFPIDLRSDSLGLELVEALAGQLGGQLQISSDNGTVFRVEFPNVQEEARVS